MNRNRVNIDDVEKNLLDAAIQIHQMNINQIINYMKMHLQPQDVAYQIYQTRTHPKLRRHVNEYQKRVANR